MRRTKGKHVRRPSHRVRHVDERRLDAEALLELSAERAHAERLGRVVPGGDERDAELGRQRARLVPG